MVHDLAPARTGSEEILETVEVDREVIQTYSRVAVRYSALA
jgi:hypothetical protein